MTNAYSDSGLAMMAETAAFIRRLKEFESATPGASRTVIDTLCAAFDLVLTTDDRRVWPATRSPVATAFEDLANERADDAPHSAQTRGSVYPFPSAHSALKFSERRSPSRGEFEYVTLGFLKTRKAYGATRQEIIEVFDQLNLDVGKASAFATRLNLTLKGGATESIGFVTWNANQKNPSTIITKAGRSRFTQLDQGQAGSPLPLKDLEALRPKLNQLLTRLADEEGAS